MGVIVTLKANGLGELDVLFDNSQNVVSRGFFLGAHGFEEVIRDSIHGRSNGRVDERDGERRRLLGPNGSELKLVSGKGKWRGAIAVRQVSGNGRESGDLDVEHRTAEFNGLEMRLGKVADVARVFDGVENFGQVLSEESRDDARGSLVGSEAVLVRSRGNGGTEETAVLVDGIQDGHETEKESVIGLGLDRWVEEIVAEVSGHGPVAVLSGAVHALERLLVEEDLELMAMSNLVERFHKDEIVVHGNNGLFEDGCHFKLIRGDFIVAGLDGDSNLVQLKLSFGDGGKDSRGNLTKVMVFELLVFWGQGSNERAPGNLQVWTEIIQGAINQEELLFRSKGRVHALGLLVTEDPKESDGSIREGLGRAEENGLFIESFTVVGDEARGNVENGSAMRTRSKEEGATYFSVSHCMHKQEKKTHLVVSQIVYPRASKVERMPPLGKEEASGSAWSS